MPKCPKCEVPFVCVAALWFHLQIVHLAQKSEQFCCKEQDCGRVFSNWKAFRKHLLAFHKCNGKVLAQSQQSDIQPSTDTSYDPGEPAENFSEPMEVDTPEKSPFHKIPQCILLFVLYLYANHSLPRCLVQGVIDNVKLLVSEVIEASVKFISTKLREEGVRGEVIDEIERVLRSVMDPFKSYSTEYRRFQTLQAQSGFIKFQKYIVGARNDDKLVGGYMVRQVVSVEAQYLPMRHVLQKLFSLPSFFKRVKDYVNYLNNESDSAENFIQGKLWRTKVKECFPGKFVIPLFIYFDDFEINNPLGSHAGIQKLGAVYYSIACLPPEFNSIIENVFMACLFHSSDRTTFSNQRIFEKVINELNFLQTDGIFIESVNERVFFSLGLLLGDNLGLNGILGFVESFSAYYFCRFCKMSKIQMQHDFQERCMRSDSYEADLLLDDVHLTGIKEKSVWDQVTYFKSTQNFCVDWLHDGPEGWGKEIVTFVLHFLVKEIEPKELRLSLNVFNGRLRTFDCHNNGISNRPPPVTLKEVENKFLKMSGSEMQNFILIFSMLVGDLVPVDCKPWKLYTLFREIMDIVMCRRLHPGYVNLLKTLVIETLALFKELFPKETIKAKSHNFTHYATVMENSGPLVNLSTARFERKHREKKRDANATTSRKNITHTLTVKEQLSLCQRLLFERGLEEALYEDYGGEKCYDHVSMIDGFGLFMSSLPSSFNGPCLALNWVKVNGVKYHKNTCVVMKMSVDIDGVDVLPVFGSVQTIIQNEEGNLILVCKVFVTYGFSSHFHAYDVAISNNVLECVFIRDLPSPFPVVVNRMGDGSVYATVRHKL